MSNYLRAKMVCSIISCISPCCFGQLRYVIVSICFFSIIVTHCQRSVLNIAIVEMVGLTVPPRSTCPLPDNGAPHTISDIKGGKVDWTEKQQNLNLASFYIGYFLMHVPSGILCDKYGSRHILIWGTFLSTVCTCLIPPATIYMEWWAVFILRVLTGFGQSVQYPCLSSLVSRWIPIAERATVGAVVFASNSFGYIVGNVGTGLMIKYTEDWTLTFYVWTASGVIFMILGFMYLFSDPRTHPYLSSMEFEYLQEMVVSQQPMKIPVKGILSDICIYGLIIGQIGHDLLTFTLANNLPKYLNNVLGFDIQTNAFFSFIYLLQWFSSFIFGKVADYAISKNANICMMRKVYTVASIFMASLALLGVGLAECRTYLVLGLLMFIMFWNGLYYCGMKVHIIDISVNMTGLIMAIINGSGSISGFFSSYIIGVIAKKNSHTEWNIIFSIMLAVQIITAGIYCFLTSCDRRVWDYRPGEERQEKQKGNKFYLELSDSAFEIKKEKEANAKIAHQTATHEARRKMRQSLRNN